MSYPNEPGKNYANINVPQATAYDLVAIASLTSNASSPLKLVVGAPVRVKYTAEDAAGNTASCTVVLKANGKTFFIVPSYWKPCLHKDSSTLNAIDSQSVS